MRVLHVYSGNLYGGIEAILVTLARSQAACPDMTQEFALAFDGRLASELSDAGATLHRLGEVRARDPRTVLAARRAFRDVLVSGRFDRVICHAPWAQAIFGGTARRAGIPLAFWAHDAMTGCHWTERFAKRVSPDLVICNSRFTLSTLPRLYSGVPAEVIYAPVERQVGADPGSRRAVRRALDTQDDAIVLVQASRSEAWKGHALLIEALSQLRDVPHWVWWQAGGAQRPAETAFLASLREAAERHGISDRIRWLGERADVRALLSAADIYCQANLAPEPFGVVFVEALLSGLPVVTTNLGGAREIVDATCGVLVEPRDASALADALRRLVCDGAWRARLAGGSTPRGYELSDPSTQLRRLASALTTMAPAAATV